MNARPGWITLIRDVVSYGIGVALMFKQAGILFEAPRQPNETLIWVAALLIGVPGVAQIVALRFGTGSSRSAPAAAVSPQRGLPSSYTGEDDQWD